MDVDDESDEDFAVTLAADGTVYGSAGACARGPAVWENLFPSVKDSRLAALRAECQLAAWPLARQSFWLPGDATPAGPLEELAMRILRFHTGGGAQHNVGAEWWANISRSASLAADGTGDINLHFDKDEKAFEAYGVVVHPLLSTVSYLSDDGAPTVLLPHLSLSPADPQSYARSEEAPTDEPTAMIVPPVVGRHLRFDGRWLHGAPAGYAVCEPVVSSASSAAAPPSAATAASSSSSASSSSYERVTFCVNIWVNHRPGRCPRFQERPGATLTAGAAAGAADMPAPPLGTSALGAVAPRLRLTDARGTAALRELRDSEARRVVLRCGRGGGDAAAAVETSSGDGGGAGGGGAGGGGAGGGGAGGGTEARVLKLEQTMRVHELSLPWHRRLHELLRRRSVICMQGRGISLRAVAETETEAADNAQNEIAGGSPPSPGGDSGERLLDTGVGGGGAAEAAGLLRGVDGGQDISSRSAAKRTKR